MKLLPKILLAIYVVTLLWLVLFKFSFDIFAVLDHQARSLNLIPFIDFSREMIDNFVVFIPFGLLLSINFKQMTLWRKVAFVFSFSMSVEMLQFILAIGVTDITDVITNTLGGLLGLVLYDFSSKHVDNEKRDQFIVVTGMILLALLMVLRFCVLRVKY